MGPPLGIGVVGCGDISARYIRELQRFAAVRVVACASRSVESARRRAQEFGLVALTTEQLVRHPQVDLVLNLSSPQGHAAVTEQALRAGRHVYSEKPLAATTVDGAKLTALAERQGVTLACAPATALGPAQQTARAMIDAGELGEVVGASASIVYAGPDLWHPDPASLFAAGAGPLFDMGVYAVNALVCLFGPVEAVGGFARTIRNERTVGAGPRAGQRFPVERPTHVVATLRFAAGPVASLTISFDAPGSRAPGLEIQGTAGTLAGPGPSLFDGPLHLSSALGQWTKVTPSHAGWAEDLWPIGVLDMVHALAVGRTPRCAAGIALHVLHVLTAIEEAVASGETRRVPGGCERPPPLDLEAYTLFSEAR